MPICPDYISPERMILWKSDISFGANGQIPSGLFYRTYNRPFSASSHLRWQPNYHKNVTLSSFRHWVSSWLYHRSNNDKSVAGCWFWEWVWVKVPRRERVASCRFNQHKRLQCSSHLNSTFVLLYIHFQTLYRKIYVCKYLYTLLSCIQLNYISKEH